MPEGTIESCESANVSYRNRSESETDGLSFGLFFFVLNGSRMIQFLVSTLK